MHLVGSKILQNSSYMWSFVLPLWMYNFVYVIFAFYFISLGQIYMYYSDNIDSNGDSWGLVAAIVAKYCGELENYSKMCTALK